MKKLNLIIGIVIGITVLIGIGWKGYEHFAKADEVQAVEKKVDNGLKAVEEKAVKTFEQFNQKIKSNTLENEQRWIQQDIERVETDSKIEQRPLTGAEKETIENWEIKKKKLETEQQRIQDKLLKGN